MNKCLWCGESFPIKRGQKNIKLYCSGSCQSKSWSIKNKDKIQKNQQKIRQRKLINNIFPYGTGFPQV